MGRRCKVYGCKTGYDSEKKGEKITIYSFPTDPDDCRSWIAALPNKDILIESITKNNGVCELHWPEDVTKILKGRHLVPIVPPGGTRLDGSPCFPNVPSSSIPTPPSLPRSTQKALSSSRNPPVNEMPAHLKIYLFASFTKSKFVSKLVQTLAKAGNVAPCQSKDQYIVLSHQREGPIFQYTIIIHLQQQMDEDIIKKASFEAYSGIKKISVPFLDGGIISDFTQLDALIHFITNTENEQTNLCKKQQFIERQVHLLNLPKNSRLYTHDDLCSAFSWYARSRALYSDLRNSLYLPSESTLKKITRISKNTDDKVLFASFFKEQDPRSRSCLLLVDEIYVKASITYSGGMLFGYSEDAPDKSANKLLCIMVKCLFTSKKFLAKIIPVHTNSSDFQYKCVADVILNLEQCGANVIAIMSDNNSINTKFFKLFPGFDKQKPYVVNSLVDPTRLMFLLFDTVHILKNIRNNWITGASQTLSFPSEGSHQPARKEAQWSCLRQLHATDNSLGKLSTLTSASVSPSSVERQKVSLVLNVISDKTVTALNTSCHSTHAWKDAAQFISMVLQLWKLFNCKSPFQCIHLRDLDRIPIDKTPRGEKAINRLQEWASIAKEMRPHGKRDRTFTRDTSEAIEWTCLGLVAMANYLLDCEGPLRHQYVCLGFYQQDDLEHHFGHFRRSAGCNYYITVKEVMTTHAIDRTRFMLNLKEDVPDSASTHNCELCDKSLNDWDLILLDRLSEGEIINDISPDEKMAIYYMAGYVASKHQELTTRNDESIEEQEVKLYLDKLNRGGLTHPSTEFFQFLLFGYAFFTNSTSTFCRKRLVTVLKFFPNMFHLNLPLPQLSLQRIANIFMKNFSKDQQNNRDQPQRKIAKLSSSSQ